MMGTFTFNICCRLPLKTQRFQITVEDVNENVSSIHSHITRHVSDLKEEDYDILYAGRRLKGDCKLSGYALQNHSTLYMVPKFGVLNAQQAEGSKTDTVSKHDIFMALESALFNHDYKNIVERMLNDSDTVENIIASIPGLDKDPAVLAMLAKPELLTFLAHRKNIDTLLKQHPSFAQAAITIATAVNEEGTRTGAGPNPGAGFYSLDQMSDEDDDEPGPSRSQGPSSRGQQNITASQLAAALQAASAASGAGNVFDVGSSLPTRPPDHNEPSSSNSGATITTDFFQQAMLQAQISTPEASSSTQQPTQNIGNALQQLRDMGIMDENVARQALAATNGDVQAAINLIFSDGFM